MRGYIYDFNGVDTFDCMVYMVHSLCEIFETFDWSLVLEGFLQLDRVTEDTFITSWSSRSITCSTASMKFESPSRVPSRAASRVPSRRASETEPLAIHVAAMEVDYGNPILDCTEEEFDQQLSTLDTEDLVGTIGVLQHEMAKEQARFNELTERLSESRDDETSYQHQALSEDLVKSQLQLAMLMGRNMKCFTQKEYGKSPQQTSVLTSDQQKESFLEKETKFPKENGSYGHGDEIPSEEGYLNGSSEDVIREDFEPREGEPEESLVQPIESTSRAQFAADVKGLEPEPEPEPEPLIPELIPEVRQEPAEKDTQFGVGHSGISFNETGSDRSSDQSRLSSSQQNDQVVPESTHYEESSVPDKRTSAHFAADVALKKTDVATDSISTENQPGPQFNADAHPSSFQRPASPSDYQSRSGGYRPDFAGQTNSAETNPEFLIHSRPGESASERDRKLVETAAEPVTNRFEPADDYRHQFVPELSDDNQFEPESLDPKGPLDNNGLQLPSNYIVASSASADRSVLGGSQDGDNLRSALKHRGTDSAGDHSSSAKSRQLDRNSYTDDGMSTASVAVEPIKPLGAHHVSWQEPRATTQHSANISNGGGGGGGGASTGPTSHTDGRPVSPAWNHDQHRAPPASAPQAAFTVRSAHAEPDVRPLTDGRHLDPELEMEQNQRRGKRAVGAAAAKMGRKQPQQRGAAAAAADEVERERINFSAARSMFENGQSAPSAPKTSRSWVRSSPPSAAADNNNVKPAVTSPPGRRDVAAGAHRGAVPGAGDSSQVSTSSQMKTSTAKVVLGGSDASRRPQDKPAAAKPNPPSKTVRWKPDVPRSSGKTSDAAAAAGGGVRAASGPPRPPPQQQHHQRGTDAVRKNDAVTPQVNGRTPAAAAAAPSMGFVESRVLHMRNVSGSSEPVVQNGREHHQEKPVAIATESHAAAARTSPVHSARVVNGAATDHAASSSAAKAAAAAAAAAATAATSVATSPAKTTTAAAAAAAAAAVVEDQDDNADEKVKDRVTLKNWDPSQLMRELYQIKLEPDEEGSSSYINMEGYMEKLPINKRKATLLKTWKRRYFKAENGNLYYFENTPGGDSTTGYFQMMGGSVEELGSLMLGMDDGKGRYMVVRCPSEKDCENWKRSLHSQIVGNITSTYVKPLLHVSPNPDKKVVVIDIGSCSVRAGILGDRASLPQVFFPTLAATKKSTGQRYFGFDAYRPDIRMDSILDHPVQPTIRVDKFSLNIDLMPELFAHVFKELKIDPRQYLVMLSTPANLSDKLKEQFMNLFINKFHAAGVNIIHQALLALYAYNATSGIVVDIGERLEILPVTDGYIVEGGMARLAYGGHRVGEAFNLSLTERKYHLFTDVEFQIARLAMEQMCYVAENHNEEMKRFTKSPETYKRVMSLAPYGLPEGYYTQVDDAAGRFTSPEGLFNPEKWGMDNLSLAKLVQAAVQACPMDMRREMWKSVFLSGGATMTPGFAERLHRDLTEIVPSTIVVQVHAAPQRYHAAFVGACTLAGLPAFKQSCITASEWQKEGPASLRRWQMF